MAGATITSTDITWPKAYVDAPDAFYHRALAKLNVVDGTLDVYNLQGGKIATYTLVVPEINVNGHEVRGVLVDDGGPIIIRPDRGCSCLGFKRTPK